MQSAQNLEMEGSPSKKPKITKTENRNSEVSSKSNSSSDVHDTSMIPSSVHESSEEIMDFDDIIHHFGDCGRYQMLLFFLMVPFIAFIAFIFYTQMLITLVPAEHWCQVPELESLSVHER